MRIFNVPYFTVYLRYNTSLLPPPSNYVASFIIRQQKIDDMRIMRRPIVISQIDVLIRIELSVFKNQKYLKRCSIVNTRIKEGVIYTIKK